MPKLASLISKILTTVRPYISSTDLNFSLLNILDNPNAYSTSADDNFTLSLAMSGNYAIVGAYKEDDAGGSQSGKAYIFDVATGLLLHTLDNPNPYDTSTNDFFGFSVGISGNNAIVGAYGEDEASGTTSGKAYIFDVTTGALLHTLNDPNAYGTVVSDFFGDRVGIDGNYAIVGAYAEDDAGGTSSGKAYIFDVTTGSLLHTLDNPNAYSTSASDSFGRSVSISGNYAIVGAYREDDASGSDSGKAYIFNVTTGALVHTLDNPNAYGTSANDNFGNSVAISGNYAIVGAYTEDDADYPDSGKAYIFNVTTGALVRTLDNPNAYNISYADYFGFSVGISGNYAIVGAYNEDDVGGNISGKAYIFDVTTGKLLSTLDNPNAYSTSASDYFGYNVAISGNYAIAGAPYEDDASGLSSGKAYIFSTQTSLTSVTTATLLPVTLENPNPNYTFPDSDDYGNAICIGDKWIAVGAKYDSGGNAQGSGVVYIYNKNLQLVQTITNPDILGGGTYYDRFGEVLVKSLDDSILFIAAPGDDSGNDANTYYGMVYAYDTSDWSLKYNISPLFNTTYGFFGRNMQVDEWHIAIPEASASAVGIYNLSDGSLVDHIQNGCDQIYLNSSTLITTAKLVAASAFNKNSGKLFVYDWQASTATWTNSFFGPRTYYAKFGSFMKAGNGNLYVGEDYYSSQQWLRIYDLETVITSTTTVSPLTSINMLTTTTEITYDSDVEAAPWLTVGNRVLIGDPSSNKIQICDPDSLEVLTYIENLNAGFGFAFDVDDHLLAAGVADNVSIGFTGTVYFYRLE